MTPSRMRLIIAADIHGLHAPLRSLLQPLGECTLLSPWPGEGHPHASEQEAAAAFHAHDGLPAYERRIADAASGQPALLIGFSVGATSLWRYIGSQRCHARSQAILYYGSRIRDHLALTPRCPASVILAEHEPSFQPHALAPLIALSGAQCAIIPGTHHGFMNPLSAHYRADLAQAQIARIQDIAGHPP